MVSQGMKVLLVLASVVMGAAAPWQAGAGHRVHGLTVRGFRIEFEKTPMAAIIHRLGPVSLAEGPGAVTSGCYELGRARGSLFLVLESSEMGGEEQAITGFAVSAERPARPRPCSPIAIEPSDLVVDQGLRVGMSSTQLRARLGPPRSARGDTLLYEGKAILPAERGDSLHPGLPAGTMFFGTDVVLRAGRVVRIYAFQVSST